MRSTYDVRLRMHERVHVITYIVFLTFDSGERLVRTMDSLGAVGVRAYVYRGFDKSLRSLKNRTNCWLTIFSKAFTSIEVATETN